ncbi:hypothetical protein SCFA_460002 [anaerobic digester metagenome]|uniref:Uncharacterized protein n=1 Tax=anaerobic digester metagenome TaxID=1263854 RepID=A0A485M1N0_9ZZZZ
MSNLSLQQLRKMKKLLASYNNVF